MSRSVFHIARFTLEAETALSIASGLANGVFDSNLVMDANDLPAIPGSALAGVLRSLYSKEYSENDADSVFGFQSNKSGDDDDSKPSSLNVSWGCIQDSSGKAIQGLQLGSELNALESDSILQPALALTDAPIFRDRVRISHKGVSANTGKFDRAVLPAGYRFSVELSLWSDKAEPEEWKHVLALLKHPLFRLGGMTRAGLGKMKLVSLHQSVMNLTTEAGRQQYEALPTGLDDLSGFTEYTVPEFGRSDAYVTAMINLSPNSYWRIGQGNDPMPSDGRSKPADLLPKMEQKVLWRSNQQAEGGTKQLLIPASSVKGALSHRMAFHANRLNAKWAEDVLTDDGSNYDKSEHCAEVRALFGYANNDNNSSSGQAGHAFIDDGYRDVTQEKLQMIMHNSIDRFSGSVRDHMLFSEEMVWGEGVGICLTVDKGAKALKQDVATNARESLKLALEDLCQGRLALGAGVSKGHGLFSGEVVWSDGGKWIEEGV